MPAYVGWVPNVAGRLSFSHLGNTRNPGSFSRINDGDAAGRLVVCYQYRRASDALLHPAYLKYVYGQRADIAFVLCAQAQPECEDALGTIAGRLYLIDEQPPGAFRFQPWSEVQALWDNECGTVRHPARDPAARARILAGLDSAFASRAFASFEVILHRDGCVHLTPDAKVQALKAAGMTGPDGGDIASYIANQAYFFIKDICHNHRHHPATADTITTVALTPPQDWASNTLFGLHRKVVELRRSDKAADLFNALGVLAYVASFSLVATSREGEKTHLKYNNKQIEDAIKASLEAAKWRQTQWNIIKTALPALMIAALNFGKSSEISTAVAEALKALLPNSIYGWALGSLLLVFAPLYYQVLDPWRIPGAYRAKRIFAARSRSAQATIWFAIACIPVFISLLNALLGVRIDAGFFWTVALWSAASWAGLLWSLPYLVTADDALLAVRRHLTERKVV